MKVDDTLQLQAEHMAEQVRRALAAEQVILLASNTREDARKETACAITVRSAEEANSVSVEAIIVLMRTAQALLDAQNSELCVALCDAEGDVIPLKGVNITGLQVQT